MQRQAGLAPAALLAVFVAMIVSMAPVAAGQERGEGPIQQVQPTGITVDEIIQRFAAKETEFAAAREKYTWRQSVKVQDLDGGTVVGQYEQVIDILFDDRGRRIENVVYAPMTTLKRITMTQEDIHDIEKLYPFVLTTEEIPLYNITYVGRQKVDELTTYVFDMEPKKLEKGKRYFSGRIWVDDQDLQIVKTRGKGVGDIHTSKQENLFPTFTTWREQVDGRYWFPTYTRAQETLNFKSGDVPIRIVVRYTNYKQFGADVKIIYGGEEVEQPK